MAHAQSNSKNVNGNVFLSGDGEANPSTFHDFLGKKCQGQAPPLPEVFLSPSADLGSERHFRNHLEGKPFYGMRINAAMATNSNQFMSNKRSNSDSVTISAGQVDSQDRDSPLLTKLLRYSGHEEDTLFAKPSPRNDATKWNASVNNPGALFHNAQRGAPFCYANRLKDSSNGSVSFLSQIAADEGSRTGIKRPRLVNSMNSAPGAIPGSGRHLASSQTAACEPEATTNRSELGMESSGCSGQMTVFYGGQAHVFDNVPPIKADAIMALAGSSGGCWSTMYKQQLQKVSTESGTSSKHGTRIGTGHGDV